MSGTHPTNTALEAPRSLWNDAYSRLRQNLLAALGFWFFVAMAVLCYLGPIFYPHQPDEQSRSLNASPPLSSLVQYTDAFGEPKETTIATLRRRNLDADQAAFAALENGSPGEIGGVAYTPIAKRHLLGTDAHGRDLLARLMQGGRISLGVGFLATLVSLVIGVAYGSVSGYSGGRVDAAMMRGVEILYSLPFMIFVILLMVVFGRSILLIFIAIGAVEWLTMARITRNQVMQIKEQEFVLAARAMGVRPLQVILRHIVPNLLGPVVVYATLSVPAIMILESVLSFLGLGVQAPNASWGSLIADGAQKMSAYPWLLIAPASFFSLTLFAMNFLGDGLRDALDAKTAKD